MYRKIICITGFEGSGKDTIASIMVKDYNFKQYSFADNLKSAVCSIFGWDFNDLQGITSESRIWREQVDEYWAKELHQPDFTPRKALQYIGTNLFRNQYNQDIWIKSLKKKILDTNDNIVIVDGRFPNEINEIINMGGICIRVVRKEPEWINYYNDIVANDLSDIDIVNKLYVEYNIHPSETSLLHFHNYDYILDNNSTLDELKTQVAEMMYIL